MDNPAAKRRTTGVSNLDDLVDVYASQIVEAVRTSATDEEARERAGNLLDEFKEKAYLSGRHILIDSIRRTLDGFDDREKSK